MRKKIVSRANTLYNQFYNRFPQGFPAPNPWSIPNIRVYKASPVNPAALIEIPINEMPGIVYKLSSIGIVWNVQQNLLIIQQYQTAQGYSLFVSTTNKGWAVWYQYRNQRVKIGDFGCTEYSGINTHIVWEFRIETEALAQISG